MAINNITGMKANPVPLTGIPVVTNSTGATKDGDYGILHYGCGVHHRDQSTYYWSASQSSGKPVIDHKDINSIKFLMQQISNDFGRYANSGTVSSPYPNFSKSTNQIIELSEWQQVRNTIAAFRSISNIDRNTEIYESFHNDIIRHYNDVKNDCLCNSDCACNNVCACNTDCGCNYSDRRLKINIEFLENINVLGREVPQYSFNYVQDSELELPKEKQIGVMAQDLLNLGLNQFVSKKGEYFQVDYEGLFKAKNK